MREFMMLIGQIIMISCVQSLTELFIDKDSRPYQAKLVNIACFAGSFYLLVQFVFEYLLNEITTVVNFPL